MKPSELMRSSLTILLGFLLFACADSETHLADNGGIGGTGYTQGEIDAFGSIFVNGVAWNLDATNIEVDGVAGSEADLRVGMNVRVVGEIDAVGDTGSAAQVTFDTTLKGPIGSAPTLLLPDGSRVGFTILGQPVFVDEVETSFSPGLEIGDLAANQVLRVSGYVESDETVRASRVDLLGLFPGLLDAEIEGEVSALVENLDGSGIFGLGALTVRYDAGTVFEGASPIVDGVRVDVEGAVRLTGNELDASSIRVLQAPLLNEDYEDIELVGLVSNIVSATSFQVSGIPVDASAAIFEQGTSIIVDGRLIEVEGRLVSGVLVADRVEDEEAGDEGMDELEVRAAITSVDSVAREVVILGITLAANGETELEDERDGVSNFGFDVLVAGDWVEIEGAYVSGGRGTVKSLHRKSQEGAVLLEGPVTGVEPSTSSLSVAGQPIPTDGLTIYRDENGMVVSEEVFFRTPGLVSIGLRVDVRDGSGNDPAVLTEATSVSLD